MQQQDVAVQTVAVCGRGAEKDRFFAQKRCAGVFHAAIGKAGDHDHVVLGKGKRLGKIVGKILDSVCRNLLDSDGLGLSFLYFRLAHVESRQPRRVMQFLERPRGEGE